MAAAPSSGRVRLSPPRGRGQRGSQGRRSSAGVSSRTIYEVFSDREDCLLAAFNHAVEGLEPEAREGWESEREWTARVRAALSALLVALDREPAVRRLVFVEALAAERELERSVPRPPAGGGGLAAKGSGRRGKHRKIAGGNVAVSFRMTALTHDVLAQVASLGAQGLNPTNREIAQAASVKDEGQISKLLARLQTRDLLENTGGGDRAAGNAWRLTPRGEQLLHASSPATPGAGQ
jgi:AcrR family transcriptional regulator